MIILTIRTDKPEAEVGIYEDTKRLKYQIWEAHRRLAETLHGTITDTLKDAGKELNDIGGIVCYAGPGSFTGLRIGLTVGNALSYAQDIPIVAAEGDGWQDAGIRRLLAGESDKLAMPHYGADVHITHPKQ